MVKGAIPLHVQHTLEDVGGGTRLRVVLEGEPGGLLRFAGGAVKRQAQTQLESDFARLKRVLEAGA